MNDIVLDNSVLSSFRTAGWLHSLGELAEDHNLIASESIWREFDEQHQMDSPPEWLTVTEVDRLPYIQNSGRVSVPDLTCIALGEIHSGMVVANDRGLKETAERRGLKAIWGTRFMLDVFESCLISKRELDDGKHAYIRDSHLNQETINAIHRAEKPK